MYRLLKFFGACSELHHPDCLLLTPPLVTDFAKNMEERQILKIFQCLCSQTYDLYQQPNFAPAAGYHNTHHNNQSKAGPPPQWKKSFIITIEKILREVSKEKIYSKGHFFGQFPIAPPQKV